MSTYHNGRAYFYLGVVHLDPGMGRPVLIRQRSLFNFSHADIHSNRSPNVFIYSGLVSPEFCGEKVS